VPAKQKNAGGAMQFIARAAAAGRFGPADWWARKLFAAGRFFLNQVFIGLGRFQKTCSRSAAFTPFQRGLANPR
jgi:hypothetical protein